jgi:cardiolipin synthase
MLENISWTTAAVFVAELLLRIGLAVRVIMRRESPGAALAWLNLILLFPFGGAIIYLLIGESRTGRLRAYHERLSMPAWNDWLADLRDRADPPADRLAPPARRLANLAEARTGLPPLDGNDVQAIQGAEDAFRAMIADIDAAASTCHLQTYIWGVRGEPVKLAEAVIRAARRGVACRVLVDSLGSQGFLGAQLAAGMRRAGVRIEDTMPVGPLRSRFARTDLRNHRKVIVIDGGIAYTGSMNFVDPRYFKIGAGVGQWLDLMVRLRGPIVEALGAIFIREWELATDEDLDEMLGKANVTPQPAAGTVAAQAAPSGPTPTAGDIHEIILAAVYEAHRDLTITTPYFVPDPALRLALESAASRGARVRIILPRRVDSRLVHYASRAYFQDLLDRGVQIYRFQGGLLHTKLMTVDGRIALLGTANLDPRSFWLNFESTLLVYDESATQQLDEVQERYIAASEPVDPELWRRRHVARRFASNAAQLFAPVL